MTKLHQQPTYLLTTSVARRILDEMFGFRAVKPEIFIGIEVSFTSTLLPVSGTWFLRLRVLVAYRNLDRVCGFGVAKPGLLHCIERSSNSPT